MKIRGVKMFQPIKITFLKYTSKIKKEKYSVTYYEWFIKIRN